MKIIYKMDLGEDGEMLFVKLKDNYLKKSINERYRLEEERIILFRELQSTGLFTDKEIAELVCTDSIEAEEKKIYKIMDVEFELALTILKNDCSKLTRTDWGDINDFIYYVDGGKYPAQTGVAKEIYGDNLVPYKPYIARHNADGTISMWTANNEDLFAEDWCILW